MLSRTDDFMGHLLPLTHSQDRIRQIEHTHPGTPVHTMTCSIKLKGDVSFALLEQAIHVQIARHDSLRTRIIEENGEVRQMFAVYTPAPITIQDFSGTPHSEIAFERWAEVEAAKPMSLRSEWLFSFHLFRIDASTSGFLMSLHSIITDRWSSMLLIEQICETYERLYRQLSLDNCSPPSYQQFVEQEQDYKQSQQYAKHKVYWMSKFETLPESLPVMEHRSTGARRRSYQLDVNHSQRIRQLALAQRISMNTFFTLIYLIYQHKSTGLEDLVIGTPVHHRGSREDEATIGRFMSILPLRWRMNAATPASTMLRQLQQEITYGYFHHKYPYDGLLEDLELRSKGYDELFRTCVEYSCMKWTASCMNMLVEVKEYNSGYTSYPMQIMMKDAGESSRLTLDVCYQSALYSETQVEHMVDHLYTLVDAVLEAPDSSIHELPNMSALQQEKLLVTYNQTQAEFPRRLSVTQLFEQQVQQTPNKWAVRYGSQAVTYKQLNERANQLARFLVCKGVSKESIVGVMTDHAIETVIGILAVLKTGGAYLPIDPANPLERTAFLLEDTACSIVLMNLDARGQWPATIFQIDLRDPLLYSGDASDLSVAHHPHDLAYMIYTSGSTGKPKGVMIEHHSLTHYIWWANKMYVEDEEVFALYSSLAFDLTVTSIFTPLISGGTIEVYRDDREEYVLHRIIRERKATVVKLTPAHLSLLRDTDNRNSSIKRFIVGGDDLKASLAREVRESFGGNIDIYNEYGPTEATVGCMIHLFSDEKDKLASVPIGVPADNMKIYVLDEQLKPMPANAPGELYIAGEGLARGYWNREELNEERFLHNPFEPGERMYRTGDMAKFLDNGLLAYCGRNDHQVKLHGYRIELGEIEASLLSHPAVKDAFVMDWTPQSGGKLLCAYVVLAMKAVPDELQLYLRERLPFYMVPALLIELEELPLNRNGKVDRKALPEPSMSRDTAQANAATFSDREARFAAQVKAVLQVENVGLQDNFYHLGGDSIKAIQLSSKLREHGFTLKVRDILDYPVLAQMLAQAIDSDDRKPAERTEEWSGQVGEWPIVSWFWEQSMVNPAYYNQSILLELLEDLPAEDLSNILHTLTARYDAFRIRIDMESRSLYYDPELVRVPVERYSLHHLQDEEQLTEIKRIGERIKSGQDSNSNSLLRACMFDLGQNGRRLLLTAHHLIIDGVSWRILLDEFSELYAASKQDREARLPATTDSVRSWAIHLRKYQDKFSDEMDYWLAEITGDVYIEPELYQERDDVASSETVSFQLNQADTSQFVIDAHYAYRTDAQELMLAALAETLFACFPAESVVIELEGHGREPMDESIDISRTVGWFTTMYPVRLTNSGGSLSDVIKLSKEKLRNIPNRGIGYGVCRYMLHNEAAIRQHKPVRLNYLGELDTTMNRTLFTLSAEESGLESEPHNPLTALIDMNAWIAGGCLQVQITYSRNRFYPSTMRKVSDQLEGNLRRILAHCCTKGDSEYTPSDFDTARLSQEELDGLLL